jgi:hypothetical protein
MTLNHFIFLERLTVIIVANSMVYLYKLKPTEVLNSLVEHKPSAINGLEKKVFCLLFFSVVVVQKYGSHISILLFTYFFSVQFK